MLSNVPLETRLGSAYVILGYVNGLRQRGHHVDVFGPEALERFKFLRRGKLFRLAWGMWYHAARHATKGQYDVVELYGAQNCHVANLLRRVQDKRFLVVAHSNGIEMHAAEVMAENGIFEPAGAWIKRWFDLPLKRTFTEVDGIVTVSDYDRKYAVRHRLVPEERMISIENPLPDDFLGLQFPLDREPLIGFVAPWYPRKGADVIEQALPLVLRRFENARFRMIGVGSGFRKEEHFPADVCDRIEVINEGASREILKKHYMEMSVLTMPSPYESFGLVASEAIACGCALVANRTGFAEALRDGEEAVLMERSDGPSLVAALSRVLSDEDLRRKVASNGWERVQQLRWDSAVETLESTYVRWVGEIRRGTSPEHATQ